MKQRHQDQNRKYYQISKQELAIRMRIEKIKKYLELNMQDKELITKIERIINERRKI